MGTTTHEDHHGDGNRDITERRSSQRCQRGIGTTSSASARQPATGTSSTSSQHRSSPCSSAPLLRRAYEGLHKSRTRRNRDDIGEEEGKRWKQTLDPAGKHQRRNRGPRAWRTASAAAPAAGTHFLVFSGARVFLEDP